MDNLASNQTSKDVEPSRRRAAPTSVDWYTEKLDRIEPKTRDVLETYSKIPPEQVLTHVHKIRDEAWNIVSYPCIGGFRFLDLSLGQAQQYPEVLQRVKQGQRLLDLGCCFGQDIRRLVVDGAPADNLYGSDLEPAFFDAGYNLFQDRSTLKAHFLAADIFDAESALGELHGTVDIIHASSFFHLFPLERNVEVARQVVKLLRPVKGSMILGRHMGNKTKAGEYAREYDSSKGTMYRHDLESWRRMWEDVGRETGTRWRVDVAWTEGDSDSMGRLMKWQTDGIWQMRYAVWRD